MLTNREPTRRRLFVCYLTSGSTTLVSGYIIVPVLSLQGKRIRAGGHRPEAGTTGRDNKAHMGACKQR
ncbi:uncharacterized protein BO95DRAFT_165940 [Aspergillus brunneoviolaceus CBS 621.78]|uniref:Uncharacterized protein n=1 Tax=Aspergillus brunneoviolaceus CBS 621.78 TaxID=1450534 RepID=A0ACD1G6D1_9EURO|nr:hypothetical protein BO95DRAFT_165940 [Aspergillus brunneoviolaceus CBS 621.78]RAH44817.1 hypothetical protein BO95DRAFT_165940 [Aspergillus brunneoviolaceus CBS 621.78]